MSYETSSTKRNLEENSICISDGEMEAVSRQLLLAMEKIEKNGIIDTSDTLCDANLLNIIKYIGPILSRQKFPQNESSHYQRLLLKKIKDNHTIIVK